MTKTEKQVAQKLKSASNRFVDGIFSLIINHYLQITKMSGYKPARLNPKKATTPKNLKRFVKATPEIQLRVRVPEIRIQSTEAGFVATLPDGRTWKRTRERDLVREIRVAGYLPIKCRAVDESIPQGPVL